MTTPTLKKLYCTTCHAWAEHVIYLASGRVLCRDCGEEREAGLDEIAAKPPEMRILRSGGPEKRV